MEETVLDITDSAINSLGNSESQCLIQSNSAIKTSQRNYSIRGINLEKSYQTRNLLGLFNSNDIKKNVVNKLNINIEKGKIYGLLGPSGCGKTTLLKCLIGLIKFDSGTLHIDKDIKSSTTDQNVNLKKLGFMPQECCLYNELTISEVFCYFGKLYCVSNDEIKSRKNFLISLLELPSKKNKQINSLSGGQLRRVSLAISLLNKPDLLMLDEPTVGMDPILRKKIWIYLEEMSLKQHTTILITTHYIEEARKANCLGFMLNGTIIEENSPQYFIEKYNQTVLEEIFFNISSEENNSVQENSEIQPSDSNVVECRFNEPTLERITSNASKYLKDEILSHMLHKYSFSLSRLNANLYKDVIKVKRNTKLLLVQLLIPVIQITFFCLCIGRTPKNLPIGIVNNDREDTINFASDIIKNLNGDVLYKNIYDTFDVGYSELKREKIFALILFDKDFSTEIKNSVFDQALPNSFKSKMHVYMDSNNNQISYTIQDQIVESIKNVLFANLNKYQGYNETDFPIIFENSSYKKDKSSFTDYMAPGIALSVIFFLSVASTASNYVLERQLGLIERSHLAGVRIIELLLSQLIIYSFLMVIQIVIVLCLLYFFLNINLKWDSFTVLIGLIFSQGFCGLCYGLCLAALFYDQETVLQLTLASFYPILLMSGIIWPIEAQPVWLGDYVSKLLPLTYATEALRNLLEKGSDFNKYKILYGYLETYSWILVFCLCFLFLFSFKKEK